MTRVERARRMLGVKHPVLDVKLYPEGKRDGYLVVTIFRTRAEMRSYLRVVFGERPPQDMLGFCGSGSGKRCCGTVVLSLPTASENTVSHELLHALIRWCIYKRFKLKNIFQWDHPTQERVVEAYGGMVSQFWRAFAEAGFERKECHGWNQKKT